MKYDFDTSRNRRGSYSLKWDVPEGELPMWVADMDFCTAPEIQEAICKRAKHGIYGYTIVPEEWYQAYKGWWEKVHHFQIEKEWLLFCTGVIPAISIAVKNLTEPGDKVLIQTPVYNGFFHAVTDHGRKIAENPLRYDSGRYEMDFPLLEQQLSDPGTTMMVLCNPHNPVGIIWNRETLKKVGELCKKHHVILLSDEIHCDLTAPGLEYIPFASVSETCKEISITAVAPTKSFNLAGIKTAAVFVPDKAMYRKMKKGLWADGAGEPNVFAVDAAAAAFTKGGLWLEELRQYLQENKQYVVEFLKNELPQITVVSTEATYLLWLDCRSLSVSSRRLAAFLRKEAKLYLMDGSVYGGNGDGFLRINIACPKELVMEGIKRLKKGVKEYGSGKNT
ncbi:pyridoxal phosphate-dependent aminotransferase [bacterium D16-51]|nr:pyridoxal phosphate-dependent aminotransferase [bacterium D16-59]RKI61150.1 pyridoxal phosphate-dependent aminotransferase [bacterium D16-51]